MAYSDQKFYARVFVPVAFVADLGTATTATVASTNVLKTMPKFKRQTTIGAIRVRVTTIPNASATNLKLNFLNGTSTFGVVTVTTATADQILDAVMTAANAVVAADIRPTITVAGTATASGDSLGDYDIYFEQQETPVG